jgi:hypothetical protein
LRARARAALWALIALLALGAGALSPQAAQANHTQRSIFQDDQLLLYSSTPTVRHTLATLQSLGVQELRITVKWSAIAPDPDATRIPAGFDPIDPFDYPASAWRPYDRVVQLAARARIAVDFNLTAPAPLWATAAGAPNLVAADHWLPSPHAFLQFAYAVGRRYSGALPGIPRVRIWSVWNEPNQPGWLAPQWWRIGRTQLPSAPAAYRQYVEAAFLGLAGAGHTVLRDTILIGELAPEGSEQPGFYTAMTPIPFLRALYCVGPRGEPLRGAAAALLGCPASGSRGAFVAANLGLFYASGFAEHPYDFFAAPQRSASDPNFVPIADLGRLERALDATFETYGVHRRIPLYLTEYGYQTDPPDPFQIVTPAEQAAYLNGADYIAWRDRRVRSVAQFLLRDSLPSTVYRNPDPRHWDTFQTGLEYADGRRKPAFAAYRMPIWIPQPQLAAGTGSRLLVWGQLRAAPHTRAQRALIQWQPRRGSFRTIATVVTRNPSGYLTARVRVPGSGAVRIAWRPAHGAALTSRSVAVSLG